MPIDLQYVLDKVLEINGNINEMKLEIAEGNRILLETFQKQLKEFQELTASLRNEVTEHQQKCVEIFASKEQVGEIAKIVFHEEITKYNNQDKKKTIIDSKVEQEKTKAKAGWIALWSGLSFGTFKIIEWVVDIWRNNG